jgi:glyoxylate/hydroxypyruvate reductase A
MALLLAPIGSRGPDWLRYIAAEIPDLEVRIWPEVGNKADIEIAAVTHLPHGVLASLPNLRLIISLTAGAEVLMSDPDLPRGVPIVRSSEPDGDPMMNETALMHVLRHHKLTHEYLLSQQRHEWKPLARVRADERKVGVMGLGMIGLPCAQALARHGFRVAGWARRPKAVDGVDVFAGRAQLPAFLARTEILVNLLAVTPQTENILCRETFDLLPKGACVINLARGQHVVDADLIDALDRGQLAAATLDAFRIEPLPKESPLWAHPRITIMPHVARRLDPATIAHRVCENILRLRRGEPLLYPIDRDAGY